MRRPGGKKLVWSAFAKQRLRVLLRTLHGALSVPEACQTLQICESRFHALRSAWLQDALELLEPRPVGRPPKCDAESQELAELRQWLSSAEEQAAQAEAREEVARILSLAALADVAIAAGDSS
jgi:hypothetical protein